jgi:hypothetical protein
MAPHHSKEVDIQVKTLSSVGFSSRDIVKHMKRTGICISQPTVIRIISATTKKRLARCLRTIEPLCVKPKPARGMDIVRKISQMTAGPNPKSQRVIAKCVGVSKTSVHRIIHEDLDLLTRKKSKGHRLTSEHCKNRTTNARKLYEHHLAGGRSEYMVTLDEAYIYLDYCNGERKVCYVKRGETVPTEWLVRCSESWPTGFMIVGGMTGRGTLPLLRIPPKAKVSGDYYVEHVLKPYLQKDIPCLYPGEVNKVTLHHDKASSHTCNLTTQYLQDMNMNTGIKFIRKEDIPVKSPDISPMDFFGFGFLKQSLFHRKARSLDGLWKALKEEWAKVTPEKCVEVFDAWKRRCRAVSACHGQHIEHVKAIHQRVL